MSLSLSSLKNELISKGVYALATVLLKAIGADDIKELADKGLDVIEDKFADNSAIIMACTTIRNAFSIEDNDEETKVSA